MTRYRYVSVVEIADEKRQIRAGKVDRSGKELQIPTPENGLESIQRRSWERVAVFTLPEQMTGDEFREWWNSHKDDDPQPSPIPEVLECMDNGPQEAEA